MTCTQGGVIFGLIALLTLVAILRYYAIFMAYCSRVAKIEGRQKEMNSIQSIEGGGMNFFEIEQAASLWRKEYLKYGDKQLNVLARRLFQTGLFGLIALIASALWYVYLRFEVCNS